MTAATGVIGPVVRMCDNPDCGGLNACDRIRPETFIGFTAWLEPGLMTEDTLLAYFTQELLFTCASNSRKVEHLIPDGMEFTVHKGAAGLPGVSRKDGLEAFTVLYSGDAATLDEALEGSPEHQDRDAPIARLVQLRDAGRLQPLEAFPDRYIFSRQWRPYYEW